MPWSNNKKDVDINRFTFETETLREDFDLSDVFHLRNRLKAAEQKLQELTNVNEKLDKKQLNLEHLLGEQVIANRELKKEKNFWKKACKEAMEKLESAETKIENIQKTSEDLMNKNKNLRIRFQNYEIEISRLKNRLQSFEE